METYSEVEEKNHKTFTECHLSPRNIFGSNFDSDADDKISTKVATPAKLTATVLHL